MAVPRFRITERQVLMLLLVTSCIAFGSAFLVTGFRRQLGQRLEQTARPRVRWMPPQATATDLAYVMAEYFDPSLMSLPSAHGFSMRMWQHSAAAPSRRFEPAAELAWLDPAVLSDSVVFLPAPPDTKAAVFSAEKLPATLEDAPGEKLPVIAKGLKQSALRVEGALENRLLLERPNLPSPVVDAALRATRVRIAVTADGRVRYAVLDRSCGNESVDTQALELARRLRFDTVSAPDPLALTWGMLKFFWDVQ